MWKRILPAMAAAAACLALAAGGALADPRPDGLWFSVPQLPADSELLDSEIDADTGNAALTYMIDAGLAILVLERFVPGEEDGLDRIAGMVGEFEGIDPGAVNVITSSDDASLDRPVAEAEPVFGKEQAQAIATAYSYPVAIAEYFTGENEDTRKNADLFIATNQWIFRVRAAISADSVEDYEGMLPGWLGGMTLED